MSDDDYTLADAADEARAILERLIAQDSPLIDRWIALMPGIAAWRQKHALLADDEDGTNMRP